MAVHAAAPGSAGCRTIRCCPECHVTAETDPAPQVAASRAERGHRRGSRELHCGSLWRRRAAAAFPGRCPRPLSSGDSRMLRASANGPRSNPAVCVVPDRSQWAIAGLLEDGGRRLLARSPAHDEVGYGVRSPVLSVKPRPGQDRVLDNAARIGASPPDVRIPGLVTRDEPAVLTLRWEVTGPGGRLFPALDAGITLAPAGQHAARLSLAGACRPRLPALGAERGKPIVHRAAAATTRSFRNRAAHALAPARAAADGTPGAQAPTACAAPGNARNALA